MGTPEDVAYAALYLASPAAGWITGTILELNGGTVDEILPAGADL
jgi:7-alpha-hydroxysteroid dehydrogenase